MNIQNVRIGPCSLTYKGTDMGFTIGGVKFTYTRKLTDLKVDKYGDSPVDAALTGATLDVTFKVAEPLAALLQPVIPEGSYITGTTGGTNDNQLGIAAGEGFSMRSEAGVLTLHPFSEPSGEESNAEDITIYMAYPSANTDLNYESNGQRVFSVTMSALVSEAYTVGRRLGHIGPLAVS